jgi:hypothetical protein
MAIENMQKIKVVIPSILIIFIFCTNKDNPISTETHNNIWLLDVTPALDRSLTLRDTIKTRVAYNFEPEEIETKDTIFDVFMIFKKQDEPIDNPVLYANISKGSKQSRKWSDTITLEYPVKDLMQINPQLKPFYFSFEMLTWEDCPAGKGGVCFNMLFAHEYYFYKNGLDTLK